LRVGGAERGNRRLGKSRRNADAQPAGDELDQRPAAGLVERIEPARQPRRQLGLAEGGEGVDDGGEGEFVSNLGIIVASVASPLAGEVDCRGRSQR
jgi:hypothetical protein